MPHLGEIAALLTVVCWTCTSILFSYVVVRIGSFQLNIVRLTLATAVLGSLALLLSGTGWLRTASMHDLRLLALSGWIGLTLGDWAYFHSLGMLGPRLATLLVTLTPPMTAVLGLVLLHEHPGALGVAGMALTLGGVAWVVLERPAVVEPRGHRLRGTFLGVLGCLGQAIGYVLSKAGMAGGINPLQASCVRMAAGTAAVWLVALAVRRGRGAGFGRAAGRRAGPRAGRLIERAGRDFGPGVEPGFGFRQVAADRRVLTATLVATALGPITGIWLSLVAVRNTQAGIASTILAMVPVFVLPAVAWVNKERLSPRSVLGAVLAVAGVAVLFWRE